MRLIDADVLIKSFSGGESMKSISESIHDQRFVDALREAPTVEVVHGRWEKLGKHDWGCSVCKKGVPYSFTGFHYCPNCGAKMDLEGE